MNKVWEIGLAWVTSSMSEWSRFHRGTEIRRLELAQGKGAMKANGQGWSTVGEQRPWNEMVSAIKCHHQPAEEAELSASCIYAQALEERKAKAQKWRNRTRFFEPMVP